MNSVIPGHIHHQILDIKGTKGAGFLREEFEVGIDNKISEATAIGNRIAGRYLKYTIGRSVNGKFVVSQEKIFTPITYKTRGRCTYLLIVPQLDLLVVPSP